MTVRDPATEEAIAQVADAGVEDALQTVRASTDAQQAWARTPPRDRAEVLRSAGALMLQRTYELAALMCREMGKWS